MSRGIGCLGECQVPWVLHAICTHDQHDQAVGVWGSPGLSTFDLNFGSRWNKLCSNPLTAATWNRATQGISIQILSSLGLRGHLQSPRGSSPTWGEGGQAWGQHCFMLHTDSNRPTLPRGGTPTPFCATVGTLKPQRQEPIEPTSSQRTNKTYVHTTPRMFHAVCPLIFTSDPTTSAEAAPSIQILRPTKVVLTRVSKILTDQLARADFTQTQTLQLLRISSLKSMWQNVTTEHRIHEMGSPAPLPARWFCMILSTNVVGLTVKQTLANTI